ncbi:Ribonuclease S-2 [Bienertia sinuspersici]
METMIEDKKLVSVKKRCGFINGVCISSEGNSGGIGLWWRDVNARVRSYSSHHVKMDVCDDDGSAEWKAIRVYGWADLRNKHLTWAIMRCLCLSSNIPVILFGDFNEILRREEKEGGLNGQPRCMVDFQQVVDDLIINLPIHNSDHAPILLKPSAFDGASSSRLLRFESYWLAMEECEKLVEELWGNNFCLGIQQKLDATLHGLGAWAKESFGSIKKRIKDAEKRLHELQCLMNLTGILEQKQMSFVKGIKIRSIFITRRVTERRETTLQWLIGNGLDVNVWDKPWIEGDGGVELLIPSNNADRNLKVADLINFESGTWDKEQIQVSFDVEQAAKILNTPLVNTWPSDSALWWPNGNGAYTVKSGY